MKRLVFIVFLAICGGTGSAQTVTGLSSPDQKIRIEIFSGPELSYQVFYNNRLILGRSKIGMEIVGKPIHRYTLKNTKKRLNNSVIISPVPEKRIRIPDSFNELILEFRENISVEFRAYNDGIAWRFQTRFKDSLIIRNELAEFRFEEDRSAYYSAVVKRADQDIYHTSFEEPYTFGRVDSISSENLIFSPMLITGNNLPSISLTESDLEDYPGMFISKGENKKLYGRFAPYPLTEIITSGEFPQAVVDKRADYIARIKGSRYFPWRVLMIEEDEKQLAANDLVYRLGSAPRIKETSWIKPGKGTDEWIIGINLFNVPFRAGINTATYKYYIDFAKRFGFDRIMMDAGWSDYKDLFRINPDLDMDEIAAYAKSKNIGLSLWTLAMTLERQLEPALEQFRKWGVDFIMTDFMDRDDQKMVAFYHRIAEATARYKIMVMFHGAFKPAGFSRSWPHAITREGVLGSEFNIWSSKITPEHNVLLPFIRMTAGPMDYEPGILSNSNPRSFKTGTENVTAQGTRSHQLSMFVIYDSPMQLFSGNPSQGYLEPDFMELLGSIPTTWDTTVIVMGKIGDYIVSARKKGRH